MMRSIKWQSKVCEAYKNGKTLKAIGLEMQCNADTVRNCLAANGVECRKRGPTPETRKRFAVETGKIERNIEITRLRLDGLTLGQIGKRFGVTRECIRQICEHAGIENAGVAISHVRRKEAHREWRVCTQCGEKMWLTKGDKRSKCKGHRAKTDNALAKWPKDRVTAALLLRAQGKSWRIIGETFGYAVHPNPASAWLPIMRAAKHHGIDASWAVVGKNAGNCKSSLVKAPAEWLSP